MAQLVIHVYMLERGGPSVPISQAGNMSSKLAQKLKQGLSFPYFLMAMETSRKSIHFFGGSGGHVSWYEDTSNACPGPGVFPIWPLARKIGKHQQAHGCLQKDTHNLKNVFGHPSIISSPLLLSFLQEVKSYLLIIKKNPDDFSHVFFSFRNLSPAKYGFHNKDSGENIPGWKPCVQNHQVKPLVVLEIGKSLPRCFDRWNRGPGVLYMIWVAPGLELWWNGNKLCCIFWINPIFRGWGVMLI